MSKIKGFKGFDKGLKCRGYQYKENADFEEEGEISCCNNGFHFCENPLDVLGYYGPASSRYCEVEGSGQVDKNSGDDSKVAVSKLHVGVEIGLSGLSFNSSLGILKLSVDMMMNMSLNSFNSSLGILKHIYPPAFVFPA